MKRYWLQIRELEWQEVTRSQFIRAERAAGFHSQGGSDELATAGFTNAIMAGKITYEHDLFLNTSEENPGKE